MNVRYHDAKMLKPAGVGHNHLVWQLKSANENEGHTCAALALSAAAVCDRGKKTSPALGGNKTAAAPT